MASLVGYIIFHPFVRPFFPGFLEKTPAMAMKPEILVTPLKCFPRNVRAPKMTQNFEAGDTFKQNDIILGI